MTRGDSSKIGPLPIQMNMTDITLLQERIAELEAEKRALGFDPVTGCANRGSLNVALEDAFSAATMRNDPMSILMIDIDDFKAVNDQHGHPFGDETLRSVANVLRAHMRASDTVGRYGGDEFCVVLTPDRMRRPKLWILTERIRCAVQACASPVTISTGTATYKDHTDVWALVDEADQALLHAKRSGKNRTMHS